MKYKFYRRMATALILCMLIFCSVGYAENIDPDNDGSQYAWGENVGWINFKPASGPGVTVTGPICGQGEITGYAWGENIGWINLNPSSLMLDPDHPSALFIKDSAGNLSGFAWSENVGWINFAPAGGGVKIDPSTGIFSGMAWGENIGWINFAPNGKPVKTSWNRPPSGSITINGGAAYTNSSNVHLTLSCTDLQGCDQMKIFETSYSVPEAYAPTKEWTLSSGDGLKELIVQFKDKTGNWSCAYNYAAIYLDTTPPTTTAAPTGGTYSSAQSVTLNCSDGSGSRCANTQYCLGPGCTPGTLYSGAISISSSNTLRFYSTDSAGNSETMKTEVYTINVDSTSPSLSITSHSNNQHVTTSSINLAGTATDSGRGDNGIQQVTVMGSRANNDTSSGSGTANWSKAVTLNSGANNIMIITYDNSPNHNQTLGTITIYYDIAPAVTCSLTPSGATVLADGSNLKFFAAVQNNTDEVQVFQFATRVTMPNGNWYPSSGWLLGPTTVTLNPHESKSKLLTQFIPYNIPFGTYTYHGYVGQVGPPPLLYNQCQFNFEVTPY
jgi:hypothetical protein